ELLYRTTGIDYELKGVVKKNSIKDFLQLLNHSNIDFLLGIENIGNFKNIIAINTSGDNDKIIGIINADIKQGIHVDNLHFGIIGYLESFAEQNLEGHHYTQYNNYGQAIQALKDGKIDVLIGLQSILDYYQSVKGEL